MYNAHLVQHFDSHLCHAQTAILEKVQPVSQDDEYIHQGDAKDVSVYKTEEADNDMEEEALESIGEEEEAANKAAKEPPEEMDETGTIILKGNSKGYNGSKRFSRYRGISKA